jgi:outer membrane protein insertion porin family
VRFLNKEGEATNEQGETIRGRTRNFIITREVQLKPGDVFNRETAQRDLRRVFGLGFLMMCGFPLPPVLTPVEWL